MVSASDKSEKGILHDISAKIDKMIGLLSIQGKSKEDQIKVLVGLDFSNSMIGTLTGLPKGTVDSIRARLKKRGQGKNG